MGPPNRREGERAAVGGPGCAEAGFWCGGESCSAGSAGRSWHRSCDILGKAAPDISRRTSRWEASLPGCEMFLILMMTLATILIAGHRGYSDIPLGSLKVHTRYWRGRSPWSPCISHTTDTVSLVQWVNCLLPAQGGSGSLPGDAPTCTCTYNGTMFSW
jgi:hypothetical protein